MAVLLTFPLQLLCTYEYETCFLYRFGFRGNGHDRTEDNLIACAQECDGKDTKRRDYQAMLLRLHASIRGRVSFT